MDLGFSIIWAVVAFYSFLCILIPEIRLYYNGTGKQLGLLGSLAFANLIWFPMLFYVATLVGLVSKRYGFLIYPSIGICFLIMFICSWIEILDGE